MSALPSAAAAIGSGFLTSLGQALVSWWALLPLTVALLMLGASLYLRRRTLVIRVRLPVQEDTQPWPAPRPLCLWCDTHECLDSTLCNCKVPCGSWLCTVKEAAGA